MRKRSHCGGFEFMPRPSDEYYKKMPARIGTGLTKEQFKKIESDINTRIYTTITTDNQIFLLTSRKLYL